MLSITLKLLSVHAFSELSLCDWSPRVQLSLFVCYSKWLVELFVSSATEQVTYSLSLHSRAQYEKRTAAAAIMCVTLSRAKVWVLLFAS